MFKKNYLFIFTAVMLTVLYTWTNIKSTETGYKIEKLNSEIKLLKSANMDLKRQIDNKLIQSSLEKKALAMGMMYPEPGNVIMLDSNTDQQNASSYNLFAKTGN